MGCLGAFEVTTLLDGGPDHAYLKSAEQALVVRWEALSGMAFPVDRSREIIGEVMESHE